MAKIETQRFRKFKNSSENYQNLNFVPLVSEEIEIGNDTYTMELKDALFCEYTGYFYDFYEDSERVDKRISGVGGFANDDYISLIKVFRFLNESENSKERDSNEYVMFLIAKNSLEGKSERSMAEKYLLMNGEQPFVYDGDDWETWAETFLSNFYNFLIQKHGESKSEVIPLEEKSLGRLVDHISKGDAIAIVSPFRGNLTWAQNIKRLRRLKELTLGAGFGYNEVEGHYVEGDTPVTELSLIMYATADKKKQLRSFAIAMGKVNEQDSILFVEPDKKAYFYYTREKNGSHPFGTIEHLGEFKAGKLGDYYTKIGKKEFRFEVKKGMDEEVSRWNKTVNCSINRHRLYDSFQQKVRKADEDDYDGLYDDYANSYFDNPS